MLYKLGRVLQTVGLLILPLAIAGNLAERLTLGESLQGSVVGMAIFTVGWMLQQRGGPP